MGTTVPSINAEKGLGSKSRDDYPTLRSVENDFVKILHDESINSFSTTGLRIKGNHRSHCLSPVLVNQTSSG